MVMFKMRDSVYLARDIPAFVMYCVNGESTFSRACMSELEKFSLSELEKFSLKKRLHFGTNYP